MKKILMLLVSGWLFVATALANELEVIDLKHRSAEELLPVIRPLLDKDEMASGMNYQLILRASPRNIKQIKRMLESLDTAPRRLIISVMQDVDNETASRMIEMSGSIGVGRNARITVPGSSGVLDGSRDTLHARVISTRMLEDDHKTQQLQVLEGNRALVRSGKSVPVTQRVQSGWGAQVIETTQYRDVNSGFYVLPRVNGDKVTLEITTQNDSLVPNQGAGNPTTRTQDASSIVSGQLGTWIALGGIGQRSSQDDSSITISSRSNANEQRTVLIKVEEVD